MGNFVRQTGSWAPERWSVFVTRLPCDGGSFLFGYRSSDLTLSLYPPPLPEDPGTPSSLVFGSLPPRSMPVPVNTGHAGPSNVDKSMRPPTLYLALSCAMLTSPGANSEDGCHDGRQ